MAGRDIDAVVQQASAAFNLLFEEAAKAAKPDYRLYKSGYRGSLRQRLHRIRLFTGISDDERVAWRKDA
ncbi:TPA: hypothetical protein ACIBE3_005162 [Salmonella enterica subsp. enterica serovar Reading]